MRQPLRYVDFELACVAVAILFVSCFPRWADAQNDSGFKFLEVKVVDPDDKPLSDVAVDISIDGAEFPMPTNKEGVLAFNIPTSNKTRLRLKVNHPGYVTLRVSWNPGEDLPENYTIRMQKGSTIGGIIQDEKGEPIEGVEIEAHLSSDNGMRGGGKLQPMLSGVIATTDGEGRWRYESAPAKRADIATDFIHPDFAHDNILGYRAVAGELLVSCSSLPINSGTNDSSANRWDWTCCRWPFASPAGSHWRSALVDGQSPFELLGQKTKGGGTRNEGASRRG